MAKKGLDTAIAEAREVTIITRKLTQEELNEFVAHVNQLPKVEREQGVSFTNYIKEKFYPERDAIIVPDITGLELNGAGRKIDVQGVDFTGSIVRNAKFVDCDLTNAVFRECDMNDVYFDNSPLINADFRGAILVGTTLGESYNFRGRQQQKVDALREQYRKDEKALSLKELEEFTIVEAFEEYKPSKEDLEKLAQNQRQINLEIERFSREAEEERAPLVKGIKVDTTATLAISYQNEPALQAKQAQISLEFKAVIAKKEAELAGKRQPLEAQIADLGVGRRAANWVGGIFGDVLGGGNLFGEDEEATRLNAELARVNEEGNKELAQLRLSASKELSERHLAYREDGFARAFSAQAVFDPCYRRGASIEQEKVYIDTSVEDVKDYLKAIKKPGNAQLTLNDFVRSRYNSAHPNEPIAEGVIVHADCSSKKGAPVKDFNRIDFQNAHLQGVNFAGSNLSHAIFQGADISYSSFESCNMAGVVFPGVIARGANFFHADLTDAKAYDNSDFTDAILIKANADGAFMTRVQLCQVKGQYANLNHARIEDANLDGADFTSASFIRANIKRTSMVGVRLDNAVLEHCRMTECDLREASLRDVQAQYADFRGVQLQHMDAQGANFSKAYFGEHLGKLCDLEGAQLDQAVMEGVEFYKANLTRASMQFANLEGAKIKDSIMEGAQLQFANLKDATARGLQAAGVDMTGAMLQGLQAQGAQFQDAILQDVNAQGANLEGAVMERANLLGTDFKAAILDRVRMEKAKVNLHSKLKDAASMDGIDADHLVHVAPDGQESDISLAEHVEQERLIEDAQSRGFLLKALGSMIQGTGSLINGVGEFVKQPFSNRTGMTIGVITGLVIALCVVATVAAPLIPGAWLATPFITTALAVANLVPGVGILTSSIALATIPVHILTATITAAAPALFTAVGVSVSATTIPIVATAAAGVVTTLGSVAAGALAGRYVVQHIKLSHIAAASAGFATGLTSGIFLGPLAPLAGIAGAAVGVMSTVAVNTTSEKLLKGITGGRTLDGLVASGIGWAGDLTKSLGGRVGITPEQAALLKEHAGYQAVDREQYAQNLAAAKAAKLEREREVVVVISVPVQQMQEPAPRMAEALRPSVGANIPHEQIIRDPSIISPNAQAAQQQENPVKEPKAEGDGPFASKVKSEKQHKQKDKAAEKAGEERAKPKHKGKHASQVPNKGRKPHAEAVGPLEERQKAGSLVKGAE